MDIYENKILEYLNLISEDLVSEILSYINPDYLVMTSKVNYLKYYKLIKKKIIYRRYESYIRNMIRHDNAFTFAPLLNENACRWKCMRNYYYNNQIFTNYLYFLDFFALENESTNCRNLIKKKAEAVLGEKWHKKVKIRNCRRWKM
tara:strand:+ start:490 stop:927 length:438 start_codon:yes stop_codon:yes gene_type:complete